MVKFIVVLGLALLVGGAYAIFDGWPYRVLERGFTEVILGALSFAAGLLLLAAAAILVEIRRLKAMVTGAMAVMSLRTERHDEPAPSAAPAIPRNEIAVPEPVLGRAAVGAGAAAIALGGALAGLSKPDRPAEDGEKAADGAEQAAPLVAPLEEATASASEPKEPEVEAEPDDWLLPPASPRGLEPQAEIEPTEKVEPDFFEAALLPTPASELSRDLDQKPQDKAPEPENEDISETDQVSENQTELAFEPEPETPEIAARPDEPSAEPGPIWWPQVDRAGDEGRQAAKAASDYDDFSALREQLTDALAAPGTAPEVEPPRRSLDVVGDWMAPRPWPPVTQPRSSDALEALEEPAAASDEVPLAAEEPAGTAPDEVQEASVQGLPDETEPAAAAEPEAEEAVPEVETPVAAETPPVAAPADQPPASDEGIVGAYQVGETHFTIYADGSIQARTPDGDYVFASMDELKAYLASEKSRLESGPG